MASAPWPGREVTGRQGPRSRRARGSVSARLLATRDRWRSCASGAQFGAGGDLVLARSGSASWLALGPAAGARASSPQPVGAIACARSRRDRAPARPAGPRSSVRDRAVADLLRRVAGERRRWTGVLAILFGRTTAPTRTTSSVRARSSPAPPRVDVVDDLASGRQRFEERHEPARRSPQPCAVAARARGRPTSRFAVGAVAASALNDADRGAIRRRAMTRSRRSTITTDASSFAAKRRASLTCLACDRGAEQRDLEYAPRSAASDGDRREQSEDDLRRARQAAVRACS